MRNGGTHDRAGLVSVFVSVLASPFVSTFVRRGGGERTDALAAGALADADALGAVSIGGALDGGVAVMVDAVGVDGGAAIAVAVPVAAGCGERGPRRAVSPSATKTPPTPRAMRVMP